MKKCWLIAIFILFLFGNASAQQELASLLNWGEQAYKTGNYRVAERCYKEIVRQQATIVGKEREYLDNLKILLNIQQRIGSYAQGDSLCRQALQISKKKFGERSPEYMDALLYLMQLKVEQNAWAETLQPLAQIVAYQKETNGENSSEYAAAILVVCQAKLLASKFDEARQLADEAATIYAAQKGKESSEYLTALLSLGNVALYSRKIEEAYGYYVSARELGTKLFGEKHVETVRTNIYISTTLGEMGQFKEGAELLEASLPILKESTGGNNLAYASMLSNLAAFYLNVFNHQRTVELLTEALAIIESNTGKKNHYYLNALGGLAVSYQSQGDLAKAEPLFLESLKIRKEVYGDNHPSVFQALVNLGGFYVSMGNYVQSKEILGQAIEMEPNYSNSFLSGYLSALRMMHLINTREDRENEAEHYFKLAQQYAARFNQQEHASYILLLLDKLNYDISNESKDNRQLEQEVQKLLPWVEKHYGNQSYRYYALLASYAKVLSNQKEYQKAIDIYGQCIDGYKALGFSETESFLNVIKEMALTYLLSGDLQSSLSLYGSAIIWIQLNISEKFAFMTEDERTFFWTKYLGISEEIRILVALLGDTAFSTLVYDNELLTKSLLLQSNSRVRQFIQNSNDEALKALWDELAVVKKQLIAQMSPVNELNVTKHQALKAKERELEKELLNKCSVYKALGVELLKSAKEVKEALTPQEAAIEFVRSIEVADDGEVSYAYYALILKKDSEHPQVVRLCEEEELRQALQNQDNEAVSGLIWHPVKKHLSGVLCSFISPVGLLHSVSFNTLKDISGNYAFEQMFIRNLLSTKDVIALKKYSYTNFSPKKAVLVGGADYDLSPEKVKQRLTKIPPSNTVKGDAGRMLRSKRSVGFDYLPGTKEEVSYIDSCLSHNQWEVSVLTDEEATKTNWINLVKQQKPSLLHLATHGYYSAQEEAQESIPGIAQSVYETAEDPLFRSGLLFTGCNYIWNKGLQTKVVDDGVLTAYEVSTLDLSMVDLVVLSACVTGLGDVQGNEGVYGLQRALRLAGAKNMIVSLREVFDQETSEFMKTFYSIWDKKASPLVAFRKTLVALKKEYPDSPEKWNGFLMIE
ncbi:CHAT domain-containing protein [Bacteroides sp. 224]|uniref:CHAT domain-containing tetratricopeptide repeat protein n=1 Tax=Bacteroides sp. 224 TaxID=2302936 RepID=UPI0013D05A9E|nr:CHAT domain-containing protein [Bacteroides sp. 224]NDV65368.1 CHAT domain-containing protein [Bacteroides sp. 224]